MDVPDLTGLSLVPANRELREVGLTMKIDGSGICVSQDPEPGERVARLLRRQDHHTEILLPVQFWGS